MNNNSSIARYKLTTLLNFMGISCCMSFFSLYFKSINFTSTQIGMLFSALFLAGGVISPLLSRFTSNTTSLQRSMPYFMCVVSITSALILICFKSFTATLIGIIIYSIQKSAGFSMMESNIVIFSNDKNISYSSVRLFGTLAFVIMTLCGGFIIDNFGFTTIQLLSITLFVISFFMYKSFPIIEITNVKENVKAKVGELFKNKKFLFFLIPQVLFTAMSFTIDSFYPLYLESRGLSIKTYGTIMSVSLCFEVLIMVLVAKYVKRVNGILGQIVWGVLLITRAVCFVVDIPIPALLMLVVVQGTQSGIFVAFSQYYIKQVVPEVQVGNANLVNAMLFAILCGIVNIACGSIIDNYSFATMYTTISIIVSLGVMVALIGFFTVHKHKLKVND